MTEVDSRYVERRASNPMPPYFNRPTVQYTGLGCDLVLLDWNACWLRTSAEFSKETCKTFIELVNGTDEEEGEVLGLDDLDDMLQMKWIPSCDAGLGWTNNENYPYPCFIYEECGEGTNIYNVFNEPVLIISIPELARPYRDYSIL